MIRHLDGIPGSRSVCGPSNLVVDDANIIDGKNCYQAGFAKQFDALIVTSSLAMADKTRMPLKKRLLSGPVPQPALFADPATGRQWLVYDACQGHRCDEFSQRLLVQAQ